MGIFSLSIFTSVLAPNSLHLYFIHIYNLFTSIQVCTIDNMYLACYICSLFTSVLTSYSLTSVLQLHLLCCYICFSMYTCFAIASVFQCSPSRKCTLTPSWLILGFNGHCDFLSCQSCNKFTMSKRILQNDRGNECQDDGCKHIIDVMV